MQTASTLINAAVAVGTLLIAVAAIWGDWLRSRIAPAKLVIESHNLQGDPTMLQPRGPNSGQAGIRVMYFHLKVANKRPYLTVKNCRVLLKGMSRRGPDGRFHPAPMSVPSQFVWAPAEITPPVLTLIKEQILDFGCVTETEDKFIPILYSYPNNFQGFVRKDEAVRYHLEVEATNFISPRYQVFEVAWDGAWSYEPEKMQQHLRITEIRAA
jgi:hypothetical protein